MADILQPKFEQRPLEKDVERISKEVFEYRKGVDKQKAVTDREVVKSVIGAKIQPQPKESSRVIEESKILPKYLLNESSDIKTKVEELINIAFQRGIDVSIVEAKKYGPFILDAFHDALTSKLYDELKARKII